MFDTDDFNKLHGAQLWYTPTQGEERKTVVSMQQVLRSDLKLEPISATNKLPSSMNKSKKVEATRLSAAKLDDDKPPRGPRA